MVSTVQVITATAGAVAGACIALGGYALVQAAPDKDKDKDKTPPIVTELRVESLTQTSAIIKWTTDEPSDSDIKYGVAPQTNINGPRDTTLVLLHAIALSGLTPQTTYAYCVTSRDAANNRAEGCGTFTTLSAEPPPVLPGGGAPKVSRASLSGYAFPHATIVVELRSLPSLKQYGAETVATQDGHFTASFEHFPGGLYTFLVTATDAEGRVSSRKGIRFELDRGERFSAEHIVMPPTVGLQESSVSWGDELVVVGSTMPRTGVLIQVGGNSYQTESDREGTYRLPIDSSRYAPGTVSVQVRSAAISAMGPDFSPTITARIAAAKAPLADIDADGSVTSRDLSAFFASPRDLTGDGRVTIEDVSVFLSAF